MSIVLAEIDSTCSYLGSFVDDEYKITSDSISCLKHLIWFLRHDGDTHEYRRHIGQSKILQKDLLPMLVSNSDNTDLSHVLLRLLVNLSYPALLLYREELPKDGPGRRNYLEIIEILQSYKEAFASKQVWVILGVFLQKVLEVDVALRADSDSLLIERVLSLIRNILQIPVNPSTENRADNDASVHDQVLWSLQQSGVLDLILYILASEFENVYHLHALEIIYLVYREQTPESLANALFQRSDTEKYQDEQELITILRREKDQKLKKIPNSRHSRFGGCYVLKDVKSISENDLICHQPIDKAFKMEFDREKNRKKKSHRIAKEENVVHRRSAFSIRLFLREFCLEILHSAFNNFVTSIRATVQRETSGGHDDSYLLWAMAFFMEFNRLSNFRLELVSESLSLTSFHWVLTRIQFNMDMITSDKKNSRLWSRRLHLGVKAYRELLYSLHTLQKFKDDDKSQGLYRMIQNNIFYVLEHRETMLHLIINYKEANSTKAYLRDVIETAHTFLKMMEKFSAGGIVVQQKSRRKNKTNVQKNDNRKNNDDDEQEAHDNEQLENKWAHIMPQLSIVLSNENLKLPGDDEIVPFDATSDKSIDDQKGDCMLKIYAYLKEEQYEHAVCMLRAGREVWMEDDCFGSFASAPEDELMILKEIFFSNLSYNKEQSSKRYNNEGEDMETTTASEMMDDNVDNKANNNDKDEEADDGYGDDEELHDEEEDEEPEFTETNFKFEEFIKRLLHPNVVRACTIMLADWEQITSRALKSAVTILHRIAVGCKMPVMLFQASLFRIFQSVLNLNRDTHNEELQRIAKHIVRKFIEMIPNNPKIYAELLFYKNLKEAYDVEFNYEDHDVGGKNQWTEYDENELRELFMENQRNPESDQDVIDWLTNNLSDKTRTRRAVIKKLKELNLIFKAPTKKTYAAAAAKFQWSVDQDTHLKTLYEEYRFEKAPLKRIYEALGGGAELVEGGKKRTKPAIIKRMIELGLILDKSEIQPPRQKKSGQLDGMNQEGSDGDSIDDDDDDDDNGTENERSEDEVDFNELRKVFNPQQGENNNQPGSSRSVTGGGGDGSKKIKKLSSLSKKASKKSKRSKPQIKPLNIANVKQLIEDLSAALPDAISWLQESIDEAAEDYDGISVDPDDAVPIVPITVDQSNAFENQKFIELLRELHINEPLKDMETYWRIPIHFTVNDLKIRSQLLTGLYEDSVLEQEINADNEDVNDVTHNKNNNKDDESENEMNKTNSDNPFDKLRRIMYNNSDNEDDDRSSGKNRFNFGRRNYFDTDTDNISVIAEDSTNVNVENKTDSDDENKELPRQMYDNNVKERKITKRVNRLIDSSDSESGVMETTTKMKRQRLELNDSDNDATDSNVGGNKNEINSRKKIRRISSSSDDE